MLRQTNGLPIGRRPPAAEPFGRKARAVVAAVALLMGVGALYGGFELLSDAEGFGVKESWLGGSPFPDYTIPALFLLVVIGGGMLITAAVTAMNDALAPLAACIMGAILLAWLAVETLTIGFHGGAQAGLLAVCSASGATLAVLGARSLLAHDGEA